MARDRQCITPVNAPPNRTANRREWEGNTLRYSPGIVPANATVTRWNGPGNTRLRGRGPGVELAEAPAGLAAVEDAGQAEPIERPGLARVEGERPTLKGDPLLTL